MVDKSGQTEKVWSKDEILEIWTQSQSELRSLQQYLLRANGSITASKLGMALQLAEAEFQRLRNSQ